jgi:sugar lactone lactonase YvrE
MSIGYKAAPSAWLGLCSVGTSTRKIEMRNPRLLVLLALALFGMAGPARAQAMNFLLQGAFDQPQGIAEDGAGNLYVANTQGNTLDRVAPDGTVTVLAGNGLNTPNGVALDATGAIYVANTGDSTILKLAADGTLGIVAGPAQGVSGPEGLVFDGAGNLYISNNASRTILKLAPGGTASIFVDTSHGLVSPIALATDAAGDLYIADEGAATISKVTPDGSFSTFASGFFVGGGLAFDKAGNLYASDDGNGLIRKISPDGAVSTFAQVPGARGLVVDGSGTVFYAYFFGNAVMKVTTSGSLSQIAGDALNFPGAIVADGTGNLYVGISPNGAVETAGAVVKIAPNGTVTSVASGFGAIGGMALARNGTLYVANGGAVDKVTPDGSVSTLIDNISSGTLALDAQGNLFVGGSGGFLTGIIVKVAPDGTATTFATLEGGFPVSLAFDKAGNLFVANGGAETSTSITPSSILKFTPSGSLSVFAQGSLSDTVSGPMVFDAGGNLLVANPGGAGGMITRYTPDGTPSTVLTTTAYTFLAGLAIDPAGNLYGTDQAGNALVQILLNPSPLASAILPGGRSVEIGSPATVFATLLNTADTAQANCRIEVPGNAPSGLTLDYRPTDPATNAVAGALDTPVSIPAHGGQTFVIGFGSDAAVSAPGLAPVFLCDAVAPAPVTPGVNTIDLTVSSTPIADIIAESATASGDGIVTVPFSLGQGAAFALATANDGAAGALTALVDTGSATLPITATLCQTDPATGQCLAPPAASLPLTIAAGATPTFSVFVSASAAIPLAPGTSRIFVRFLDGSGASHGSTSVAVEAN